MKLTSIFCGIPQFLRPGFLQFKLIAHLLAPLIFCGIAAACGSHEQEDREDAPSAAAPGPTPTPLAPTRSNGAQNGSQTPKSTNSLTSGCSDDLQLATQVGKSGNNSGTGPEAHTVLIGKVAPDCAQGKTPVLTFSTEHPLTLLPLMRCDIGSGRPAQITCRGNAADIFNEGTVTIPVLLDTGTSYTDLRATIDFQ